MKRFSQVSRPRSLALHTLFEALPFVVAAVLLLSGCGSEGQAAEGDEAAPQRTATRVETLRLQPTTFEDAIQLTGSVEAVNDATLSAEASGTVTSIAELGERVRRGQLVARLNAREASAAVEQAQAQLESAQAQGAQAEDSYERQEPLYRDSVISAIEFEQVRSQRAQAQAGVSQARASLSQAQERLARTRITAPFAGTVEERMVETGEQISPGQPVARVVSTEQVKVTAGVPERYAGDIEKGTAVEVRVQSSARIEPRRGQVSFVGSAINAESRTFPVEVRLGNPEGTLKPEMVVQMQITRETIDSALVVPRTAVIRDEEGTDVYVVSRTDTSAVAQNRPVTLGSASGGSAVIESGLQAGDEVIVTGQSNVSEGDPVEVTDTYDDASDAGTPAE